MKTNIKEDFVDEKGNNAEIYITSPDESVVKLNPNYKLQRPDSNNKYMKKGAKAKSIFTTDVGIKSQGFAPIFTLALIIALGLVTIAFILWRVN